MRRYRTPLPNIAMPIIVAVLGGAILYFWDGNFLSLGISVTAVVILLLVTDWFLLKWEDYGWPREDEPPEPPRYIQ